ncbi:hypothetical protein MKJ01_07840 [Chryseobacterium sp. SSA4.19]|uniref:hypothetical protein n=1 Tax=Chryseobacterium sp. SSA4.19 TaxID=2919915 RepID=UPI001F4E02C3|nr:hypothetical protein [Chryseobacterium sp. SSA4.19]MCJ8153674.1 hypothetical protein [Chryseobacterium sp. SSA4.19]
MELFKRCISLCTEEWKEKYKALLYDEHLQSLTDNIQKFKNQTLNWDRPFFNEEIPVDRNSNFTAFIPILESQNTDQYKAQQLEQLPFEHWLNILGQRLTPASIRDENAIPPLRSVLIEACEKPFNQEITTAQRAWEKHAGRTDSPFWGDIQGNNEQKLQKVAEKIHYILDHKTWWNVFFHYKHGLVFEVREKEGHGIRWSHGGTELIGFLEVFINK